ncbi:hypothetical protein WA158_002276 [Blastocystis sp. Blastoise]
MFKRNKPKTTLEESERPIVASSSIHFLVFSGSQRLCRCPIQPERLELYKKSIFYANWKSKKCSDDMIYYVEFDDYYVSMMIASMNGCPLFLQGRSKDELLQMKNCFLACLVPVPPELDRDISNSVSSSYETIQSLLYSIQTSLSDQKNYSNDSLEAIKSLNEQQQKQNDALEKLNSTNFSGILTQEQFQNDIGMLTRQAENNDSMLTKLIATTTLTWSTVQSIELFLQNYISTKGDTQQKDDIVASLCESLKNEKESLEQKVLELTEQLKQKKATPDSLLQDRDSLQKINDSLNKKIQELEEQLNHKNSLEKNQIQRSNDDTNIKPADSGNHVHSTITKIPDACKPIDNNINSNSDHVNKNTIISSLSTASSLHSNIPIPNFEIHPQEIPSNLEETLVDTPINKNSKNISIEQDISKNFNAIPCIPSLPTIEITNNVFVPSNVVITNSGSINPYGNEITNTSSPYDNQNNPFMNSITPSFSDSISDINTNRHSNTSSPIHSENSCNRIPLNLNSIHSEQIPNTIKSNENTKNSLNKTHDEINIPSVSSTIPSDTKSIPIKHINSNSKPIPSILSIPSIPSNSYPSITSNSNPVRFKALPIPSDTKSIPSIPHSSSPVHFKALPIPSDTKSIPSNPNPVHFKALPIPSDTKPIPSNSNPVNFKALPIPSDSKPNPSNPNPVNFKVLPISSDTKPIPSNPSIPHSSNPVNFKVLPIPSDTKPIPSNSNPVNFKALPISSDTKPIPSNSNPVNFKALPIPSDSKPNPSIPSVPYSSRPSDFKPIPIIPSVPFNPSIPSDFKPIPSNPSIPSVPYSSRPSNSNSNSIPSDFKPIPSNSKSNSIPSNSNSIPSVPYSSRPSNSNSIPSNFKPIPSNSIPSVPSVPSNSNSIPSISSNSISSSSSNSISSSSSTSSSSSVYFGASELPDPIFCSSLSSPSSMFIPIDTSDHMDNIRKHRISPPPSPTKYLNKSQENKSHLPKNKENKDNVYLRNKKDKNSYKKTENKADTMNYKNSKENQDYKHYDSNQDYKPQKSYNNNQDTQYNESYMDNHYKSQNSYNNNQDNHYKPQKPHINNHENQNYIPYMNNVEDSSMADTVPLITSTIVCSIPNSINVITSSVFESPMNSSYPKNTQVYNEDIHENYVNCNYNNISNIPYNEMLASNSLHALPEYNYGLRGPLICQDSTILGNIDNFRYMLMTWFGYQKPWRLTFVGSKHGFSSSSFHNYCDNKGETLVIIQGLDKNQKKCIFGGYTKQGWKTPKSSDNHSNGFSTQMDSEACLFSLFSSYQIPATLYRQHNSTHDSIIYSQSLGPSFTNGFNISSECQMNEDSSISQFITSYYGGDITFFTSIFTNSNEPKQMSKFSVDEYEVYTLS